MPSVHTIAIFASNHTQPIVVYNIRVLASIGHTALANYDETTLIEHLLRIWQVLALVKASFLTISRTELLQSVLRGLRSLGVPALRHPLPEL